MQQLIRVSEDEIRQIVADKYGVRKDDVTIHTDYMFVKRNGDKVRQNFHYCIVNKFTDDG